MADILNALRIAANDMEYMDAPGEWVLPVTQAHSVIVRQREEIERLRATLQVAEKGLRAGVEQYASRDFHGNIVPGDEQYPWIKLMQIALDATTAALTAQPAAPVSPWMPIETAPKDGMRLNMLLCHDTKKWVRMGRYYSECRRWYYSGTNERSQYAQVEGDEPTHWMPLPAAPGGDND